MTERGSGMAGADGDLGADYPVTDLDQRFGEEGADALPWADALGLLERAELSWLSTVARSGRPHVTPILTVVVDGTVRFCTGATEQKAKNLEWSPEVALTTGANVLYGGTDVVIDGTAVRVVDDAELLAVADGFEAKYGPRWRFEVEGTTFRGAAEGAVLVFEVVPRVGFGFAKGPFAQTRWRFATS